MKATDYSNVYQGTVQYFEVKGVDWVSHLLIVISFTLDMRIKPVIEAWSTAVVLKVETSTRKRTYTHASIRSHKHSSSVLNYIIIKTL